MIKRLLFALSVLFTLTAKSQCPQVFDYLGNLTTNPYWLSCSGNTLYTLNFQSPSSWGTYTINWGDGQPNQTGGSYTGGTTISHTYTSMSPDTFIVTLIIPSLNCTLTGVVVMEKPVNASIQIPPGGVTQGCAPAAIQFVNASTDPSETTKYRWIFGDGTPPVFMTYTNAGATVTHTYQPGTVNCLTSVTLQAWNHCSQGNTTIATYNPIQIYDKDVAQITPDKMLRCWPDNSFTFTNTTIQNCVGQGNTFQRQEKWNFGNYWGFGNDSIYNWSPWPPPASKTIAFPSIGTYSVQLLDSSFCGISTTTITVTIINPPVAGVAAPAGPNCQNTAINFTNTSGPGFAYMWNFGDGGGFNNLGPGNKSHTYSLPGTYTVQVAAYIPNAGTACTSTANVVINILPSPTSNFSFTPTFGCNTLTNVVFTQFAGGAVSYSWTFGNGNTSNLQVPPSQNYMSVGSFTASLQVASANTCVHTKTALVVVHPSPVVSFTPSSACVGSVVNFTNTSTVTGTNPINTYTWNFGDGSPTTIVQNPPHTFTTAGVYSVQLTVSTAFCSSSATQTFQANVKPTASFVITPTAACSPFAVTFTNSSVGATAYLWKFGTIPTATSNLVNPSFTYTNGLQTNQTYTATLIASTGAGCADSIKKNITVFPIPVTSFTSNTGIACSPLPVTFTNTSTGAQTYSWTFGDGGNSNLVNPVHTYTNQTFTSQTFTVQLVSTSSVGCTSSSSQALTVFPKPNYSVTMNPPNGCTTLTVNFPALLGAISYSWNFGDGGPVTNSVSPTHAFTNTTAITKVYTVTLMAENAFGCKDTAEAYPTVFPRPAANYTSSSLAGCTPFAVTFSNTSVGSNSSFWNFNNGQTAATTDAAMTFSMAPGSPVSTFSVKLVVGNANNCKDSVTKVVSLFAVPKANFALDSAACSPKIFNLTNTSTGATNYQWDFGANTSTLTNPTHIAVNNTGLNQTNTISLVARNNDNCTDTIKLSYILHPKFNFNISAVQPDSGCTPLPVFFPNVTGVVNYQWTFGDGNTASSGSVMNTYVNTTPANKTFTAQLIGRNVFGCGDTSRTVVKVFPKPTALFQADPLTVFIPQKAEMINLSTNGTSYLWDFGDGTTSTEQSPKHSYMSPGEYAVVLITQSGGGCADTFALADKIVALGEVTVQIPNAFTPNPFNSPGNTYNPNDKSNDIFHPVIKGTEKYTLSIFSRWGELIYETKKPEEGWDGYYKGRLCTQDVYVWKISATFIDGNKFDKTGDVLLLIK